MSGAPQVSTMNPAKLLEEMNQKPEMKFVAASVLHSEQFDCKRRTFFENDFYFVLKFCHLAALLRRL